MWWRTLKVPERIDLDLKQVDALLMRVESGTLQDGDYKIIKAMVETIHLLSQSVDKKAASIRRLLRMLFGDRTEKLENVLKNKPSKNKDVLKNSPHKNDKPKGHGRKKAADYTGAEKIDVPHADLKPGDICPGCLKGKVYEMKVPEVVVRVTGKAPLDATVYRMQKLCCNLCGEIFKATAPDGVGDEKYDAESGAMIALLKYGSGMPFNRIEQLQGSLGVPLAASTQWEIVDQIADRIYPVYPELNYQAAQGDVVYNDDTTMKILELMKENDEKDSSERKGIFTTGILSTTNNRKIALFYTGRQHAGENMADLLKHRQAHLPLPVQMCDALSRNTSEAFKTILANCLAHGRRKFVEVAVNFPEQCQYVLDTLAEVYKNDTIAKDRKLTPGQRLSFHQRSSSRLMKDLKNWLDEQLDQKKVEPNSSLGQAITYMLKHWKPLTAFLRIRNAPLDNNICERALKKAILHRKNALFYKTEHGAKVGDLFMSLIHTCNLAKVNPFDYLTALQKHSSELAKHPGRWMPWNYQEIQPKS
ncbi:MAG: IS66 family transposase [Deltaproteobacteria bacterium]|nr:MAG: IS66 family transposase [Deltaproteobacteria bacterium]